MTQTERLLKGRIKDLKKEVAALEAAIIGGDIDDLELAQGVVSDEVSEIGYLIGVLSTEATK